MNFLPVLLLTAGAPDAVPPPAIRIDPCVEVDADEVRRLTAIELGSRQPRGSFSALDVVVSCHGNTQELRLTDHTRDRATVRSIDLETSGTGAQGGTEGRDAKTRELALVIAELLRRHDGESAEPVVVSAPAVRDVPPAPAPAAESSSPSSVREPWRAELAVAGVEQHWTGGETLFGLDLTGRARLSRWLLADLRFGGRTTAAVTLANGSIDARGLAAAAGLALDATPGTHRAGISFGVRLGADWLRYATQDRQAADLAGKDAAAVNLGATTTGFLMFAGGWCVVIDASAGGALHSVAVRENDRVVSAMRGVLLSSSLALGAHF